MHSTSELQGNPSLTFFFVAAIRGAVGVDLLDVVLPGLSMHTADPAFPEHSSPGEHFV